MKAALVNTQTDIVENIIVVGSTEDPVESGYTLVEIPVIEIDYTQDEKDLYDMLQQIDSEFVFPPKKVQEQVVRIGLHRWIKESGVFE